MAEAKRLAAARQGVGERFVCERSARAGGGPTGSIGTLVAELSADGKPQAELTCVVPGCTETHLRRISDWHHSTRCRTHAGKLAPAAPTPEEPPELAPAPLSDAAAAE